MGGVDYERGSNLLRLFGIDRRDTRVGSVDYERTRNLPLVFGPDLHLG